MINLKNINLKISLFLSLSIMAGVATPSYSKDNLEKDKNQTANLSEKKEAEPDQATKDRMNFVSKYEVDINDKTDKKYVFDFPTTSLKFTTEKSDSKYKIFINNTLVEDKFLGKTQKNNKTGLNSYTFYGLELNSGKNIIKAQELDLTGKIIREYLKEIFVKSKPAKITIESTSLPADGRTTGKVKFLVIDEFGNAVPNDYPITVRLEFGNIISKDTDSVAYGHQLKLIDGKAEIEIKAPNTVGVAKIDVDAGDVRAFSQIEYNTPYKEPVILAIGNLAPSYTFVDNNLVFPEQHNISEKDNKIIRGLGLNFGGNVFAQGTIFNDLLLTMGYSGSGWGYEFNELKDKNLGFKKDNIKSSKFEFKDTSRKLNGIEDDQNILLRDRAEDRLYPIYGDSSQIQQIATANSPYFFKLEKNLSSLMWGDFITGYKSNEFTNPSMSTYNRTMSGAKLSLDIPNITNLDLFYAPKSQAFGREEFDDTIIDEKTGKASNAYPLGSTFYRLKKFPLVTGSERITIETRQKDANNSNLVTSKIIKTQKVMNRLSDYNIDYSTGTIVFSQPVPINEGGNAQTYNVIVVNYEHYPKDAGSGSVVGGKFKQPLGLGISVGGSYVKELPQSKEKNSIFTLEQEKAMAISDYQLWGANISEKLGDNLDFIFEYANSTAVIETDVDGKPLITKIIEENTKLKKENPLLPEKVASIKNTTRTVNGNSYRAALSSKPIEGLTLQGEYQRADLDFINRTGASFTPGANRYIARGDYKFLTGTNLSLDFNRSEVFDSIAKLQNGQILQTLTSKIGQTFFGNNISLGYENRLFPNAIDQKKTSSGHLLNLAYRSPSFFNLSFNAGRDQNLAEVDISKPTTTYVGADYNLGSGMKLFAKYNLYDVLQDVKTNKIATAGALSVGIDSGFNNNESDFFNSVNVGAKYKMDGFMDPRTAQNTYGLNGKFGILPGLSLGGGWDWITGKAPTGFSENYTAWSATADFAPSYSLIRASAKVDFRLGDRPTELYSLNLGGAITDDIGLFGRFNHTKSTEVERPLTTEGVFGFAYRPIETDYFNALGKYQIKRDYSGGGVALSNTLKHVPSLEVVFEPSREWEIFVKGATKISYDKTEIPTLDPKLTNTQEAFSNIGLGVLRGTYKFAYNFDIIGEYRALADLNDRKINNDVSLELGYYPIKNLRIGIGYNFFGGSGSIGDVIKDNDALQKTIMDIYSRNYLSNTAYINMSYHFDSIGQLWQSQGIFTKKDSQNPNDKLAKN
ncbi:MAG: hypothetical protein AABZ74_12790 [Cyanobacteriota bacterium]